MNVLVTGGCGYIGSHLVSALRRGGHKVWMLDLGPESERHLVDPGCEFIQGSVADRHLVHQAVQDIDVVYHLAWSFLAWPFYPELRPQEERREMRDNLFGALNLLEAAHAAGVQHFLFSSSAVVYGPTGPARVDEQQPCRPERSTLGGPVYGITKLACEKLCLVYQRRGLPVTVFRIHGVFSQESMGPFLRMVRQALAGQPVQATQGAGGEYIHVEDVLHAFLLATNRPEAHGEVFNLAGLHTYHEPEIARYVVEAAGSSSQIDLIEDPMQGMISVSVDKLRRVLGYVPGKGEFLTGLVRGALDTARGDKGPRT